MFLAGGKTGSSLDFMLADVSVVISIALKYGIPPAALARVLRASRRRLMDPRPKPASIVGATIDLRRHNDRRAENHLATWPADKN